MPVAEGYRLVHMESLREFVDRIHSASQDCASASIRLVENESDRFGLSSSLYAICDSCAMKEFLATGCHNISDRVPRSSQGKDINRRKCMFPMKWEWERKVLQSSQHALHNV